MGVVYFLDGAPQGSGGQFFQLIMSRIDMDDPMEPMMRQFNFTERDMIDGRYFDEQRRTFRWAHGREHLSLRLPSAGFEDYNVHDLLPFTEIIVIDLTDEAKVAELIGDFSPQAAIHETDN